MFNSGSKLLLCNDGQKSTDCTIQYLDIIFDARGGDSGAFGVLYGKHRSLIFLFHKNNPLATLAGKYDFSSYTDSGDILDSVSEEKAVFSTVDVPTLESGELKFITGDEYIKLVDFGITSEDLRIYDSFSITVNIWIKLNEAPDSYAYIFRCQVPGESVRI